MTLRKWLTSAKTSEEAKVTLETHVRSAVRVIDVSNKVSTLRAARIAETVTVTYVVDTIK